MNKPTFKELYYLCVQKLTNFPYIEEDFDALTNYELLCKVVEELNKMIDNMNTQNESIIALYDAFNTLKTYVDNYFDNLDVQEEINNKLDEMAQDGTLEEIVDSYLRTIALFCFDTVEDMKQSTKLIEGSYARTLGYYEINDGGGATYIVREKLEDDEYDLLGNIELDDYTLERIETETVSLGQFCGSYEKGDIFAAYCNSIYNTEKTANLKNKIWVIPDDKILYMQHFTIFPPNTTIKGGKILIDDGGNYVSYQSVHGGKIMFLKDNITFENVEIEIPHVLGGSYLVISNSSNINLLNCKITANGDGTHNYQAMIFIYNNWKNILFDNLKVNISCQTTNGAALLVSNQNSTENISSNLKIYNSEFISDSGDETVAIMPWTEKIKNIIINNTLFHRKISNASNSKYVFTIFNNPSGEVSDISINNCKFISDNTTLDNVHKMIVRVGFSNTQEELKNIKFNNCYFNGIDENEVGIEIESITSDSLIKIDNCNINGIDQDGIGVNTNNSAGKIIVNNTEFFNCIPYAKNKISEPYSTNIFVKTNNFLDNQRINLNDIIETNFVNNDDYKGYMMLDNGLMLQWVRAYVNWTETSQSVTLPKSHHGVCCITYAPYQDGPANLTIEPAYVTSLKITNHGTNRPTVTIMVLCKQ